MVTKKSAAQLRRMQARAASRGETYTPPEEPSSTEASAAAVKEDEQQASSQTPQESDESIQTKLAAAEKLEKALATLEANPDGLNSKDRRSAKRKAEAIATEECDGMPAQELLEWYEARKKMNNPQGGKKKAGGKKGAQLSQEDQAKADVAKKLRDELAQLEANTEINAKERRSAKRKAEAIATEETGCQADELLQWYQTVAPTSADEETGKKIPYIVFVGQLSFSTTADMLFEHFQTNLGSEVINKETTKVRLLTDPKTKKSRGMAFVELSSPESMYECLKLHLTHLDGRRLNVERTSGGGKAAKKSKITSFRESQSSYISQTVDQILSDHMKNGDIMEGELDEGVIALCKRHSAQVVEHALKEYAEEKKVRKERKEELGEKEEEEMRNPSAFLTHMLGRIAVEGFESSNLSGSKRGGRGSGRGGGPGRGSGRSGRGGDKRGASRTSVLEEGGVDMSASSISSGGKIQQIFPSMQRGRGRGRGYM
ncbi:hypothetical protein ACHAXM_001611 [Skeletonema potamos]|jgi:RNA recognition motif-containing protein